MTPESQQRALSHFVFWTLAEYCAEFHLPFDLMIGVNRRVYEHGVYQGQDLYDSRVSLIQYRQLLNSFPQVTFPISVLASVTNQELTSYAWIFPNVVTNGHWWYSNIPTFIERDARARLQAVPKTKQLGYYSDAYKLEFVLPKFAMYKRILARILAELEHIVQDHRPEVALQTLGGAGAFRRVGVFLRTLRFFFFVAASRDDARTRRASRISVSGRRRTIGQREYSKRATSSLMMIVSPDSASATTADNLAFRS